MEPPSSNAFAKLIPSNTAAKLAFHAMYEDASQPDKKNMFAYPEQQYDKGALLYRLQEDKAHEETDNSDSLTDPDTDTEKTMKQRGMIWVGWLTLHLHPKPNKPTRGWTIGKGGRRGVDIDYLLPRYLANIRAYHARFNFHGKTGYLFISKTSNAISAELSVNGKDVNGGEQFSLNQSPMHVRVGDLGFEFQYTDYASTDSFYRDRQVYMEVSLGTTSFPNTGITPTPTSSKSLRCFGEWTISNNLGKGAYGKVSSATNYKGEVVAIKVMEYSKRTAYQVNYEIDVLTELHKLAEVKEGDKERLIRLKDTLYQNRDAVYSPTGFEEIALILEPAASATFAHITSPTYKLNYDIPVIASLFHDALLGLNFLHTHNWIHGDLKPGNIGILNNGTRAILLDFGEAVRLEPGERLPTRPGRGGTVNYLAPERELQDYDRLIDVWSMGVIGFEILHGHHPWKLALNPWRSGSRFETLRPIFNEAYRKAIYKIESHTNIGFNELLPQMLRHPWAEGNNGIRIVTGDALRHICWRDSGEGQPLVKRCRS
ncbi:putative non-specific serine/threonine protein kinase [Microsporum canis]